MTAAKPPKAKLSDALRANLRRRKAQQQDRKAQQHDRKAQQLAGATDSEGAAGVRYSGFAVREKSADDGQAIED